MALEEKLELYHEMYDLTKSECGVPCLRPQRCCSPDYCETALSWAKQEYGVDLPRTNHPTLPLMGPNGCTAAPQYRPICTMQNCSIGKTGSLSGDPTGRKTERYFQIRRELEADYGASERLYREHYVARDTASDQK